MCTTTGVCETAVHELKKLDDEWFARQAFIGCQAIDEATCLLMVNCREPGCGSTLAKVVPLTIERIGLIEESMRRAREFAQMVKDATRAVHA